MVKAVVVVIDKKNNIKESKVNNFTKETLYKKCNLKSKDHFKCRHTWKYNNSYLSVFAKDSGRANNENKCELPRPIDEELYFGSMLVVHHSDAELTNDNVLDAKEKMWESFLEKEMGAEEDLGEEDSYSEEEEIPEDQQTKEGYMKDGFVVSDKSAEDDEDYVLEDDDEDIDEYTEDDEDDEDGEYYSDYEEDDEGGEDEGGEDEGEESEYSEDSEIEEVLDSDVDNSELEEEEISDSEDEVSE